MVKKSHKSARRPQPPSQHSVELTPADIRRIREKLRLSQVEAGEILGGGPRAFTKYENGTIKPAAAVNNILRLLDASPTALATLAGKRVSPIEHQGTGPLEVSGEHIAALSDRRLTTLLQRLLATEAQSGRLPMDGIVVAANITVGDGGEDGRIEWIGGPERTAYLPSRLSQFQLKATEISPAEAGAEVLTADGQIKPMVRAALESGGTYIMICSRRYNMKQITKRIDRIGKTLGDWGLTVKREQIQFRDASQIAQWANASPAVAAWILEQTQPGLVGPFRDWTHWAGRFEHHSSPWVPDSRLEPFRARLRSLVTPEQGVARVVGLSGVGKSRLTLEALGPTHEEERCGILLSALVLYAVESEAGSTSIKTVVQNLADSGVRAVVVIDRCVKETHDHVAAMAKWAGSRLSLITIDHEVPRRDVSNDTLLVEPADKAVINALLEAVAPNLPRDDHERLLRFSSGFPQMARLLGQVWLSDGSIASASNDALVDRIVLGRTSFDRHLLKDASMLLSTFGLVGAKAPLNDLSDLAPLSRNNRTADDLRAAFDDLSARGVAQYRGRLLTLQPRPIALALAEQQWRQWSPARWDDVLVGTIPAQLRKNAVRQLALLNDRAIAAEVVWHVCRHDGVFETLAGLRNEANAYVLAYLAEVDAQLVLSCLERLLAPLAESELRAIDGTVRRQLVRSLEAIAFNASTFERSALLLFRLALEENEKWSNNATGQFKGLFPALSGNTEADGVSRLRLLDELIRRNDPLEMPLVVETLANAAATRSQARIVGPEIQGSRPALEPWRPKFWRDYWDYAIACIDRLVALGMRSDEVGNLARRAVGNDLRTLISAGLVEHVERWTKEITKVRPYWPEALESLSDVLQYDKKGLRDGEEAQVRALIAALTPETLPDRVRFLVTDMPWDFPSDEDLDFEERGRRQVEAVQQLVGDLLKEPDTIRSVLPQLSKEEQRTAFVFGMSLAQLSENPLEWMDPIRNAYLAVPKKQRNHGVLVGYFAQLAKTHPETIAQFKRSALNSMDFAGPLVDLCASMGLDEQDVDLVREGLRRETIPPHLLSSWAGGGVLAKLPASAVRPLFDDLLVMNDVAYSVALLLMGMYIHGAPHRLEDFRSQVKQAATNVHRRGQKPGSHSDAHHFEVVMKWLLGKGWNDADARVVALTLAKQLALHSDRDSEKLIAPLLPKLLSEFAPIVWPVLSQVIGSNRKQAWKLEHILGDKYVNQDKRPPLLSLPEDILFAWCHALPAVGPAFVARVAPVLTTQNLDASSRDLHPMMHRLLNEFGDQEGMLQALAANMYTFEWSGTLSAYFALYQEPLQSLLTHPTGKVRRWAQDMLTEFEQQIKHANDRDKEREAAWEI